jgi:CRISPR-associated protein Csb2
MTSAAGVARQLRRTLMKFADPVPELLSGHTHDRSPSDKPHLAVVPLPFVGHVNASGLILGVALVLPRAASASDRKDVFRAVATWEAKSSVEDEDAPFLSLHLGDAGDLLLERVDWGTVASTLTAPVWCRPAYVWSSVTPVALDHNPGELRSRDPQKLTEAVGAAQVTFIKACERIGLPVPVSVEILPAAPWAQAAKASHYPRFPASPDRTQRVLTHVRLIFDVPVAGPVMLGAGRYMGLGLFRPEDAP